MASIRRRPNSSVSGLKPPIRPDDPPVEETEPSRFLAIAARLLIPLSILLSIAIFLTYSWILTSNLIQSSDDHVISAAVDSDNEVLIGPGRLPLEDAIPDEFDEQAIACMPSVTRQNGGAEYVSNAVKSWRLATNTSVQLRRLVVFDMDVNADEQSPESRPTPKWIHSVFSDPRVGDGLPLPSWLLLKKRSSNEVRKPRQFTYGDSEARVLWRSKEALDYAEVLLRCSQLTSGKYVIIAQDDVLFRTSMKKVVDWCEKHMVDSYIEAGETGRRKIQRICGASLFDLASAANENVDGHLLDSSNMVARVWEVERVEGLHRYFAAMFDEAPVDWLADQKCKGQRRGTVVMEPNPVRHRGAVSSFAENKRMGTLT